MHCRCHPVNLDYTIISSSTIFYYVANTINTQSPRVLEFPHQDHQGSHIQYCPFSTKMEGPVWYTIYQHYLYL